MSIISDVFISLWALLIGGSWQQVVGDYGIVSAIMGLLFLIATVAFIIWAIVVFIREYRCDGDARTLSDSDHAMPYNPQTVERETRPH